MDANGLLVLLPNENEKPLDAGAGVAAGVVEVFPALGAPNVNGVLVVDAGVVDGRAPNVNGCDAGVAEGVVEGGFPNEKGAGVGVAGVADGVPKLNGVLFVGVLRSTAS